MKNTKTPISSELRIIPNTEKQNMMYVDSYHLGGIHLIWWFIWMVLFFEFLPFLIKYQDKLLKRLAY
jgi:hypothetical protein